MPKPAKPARGRPKTGRAMKLQINVRVDAAIRAGIEKYQARYADRVELPEFSDAVRHMLKRVLREEGLLTPAAE